MVEGKTVRLALSGAALAMLALPGFARGRPEPHANHGSPAAVIDSARLEQRGRVVELHFGYRGDAPRWRLSTRGNELRLDFRNAGLSLPARPVFGFEIPPVALVRALALDARIVIEVSGRTDYALARVGGEIVVRLAPAGVVPDLAAPFVERLRRASSAPAQVRLPGAPPPSAAVRARLDAPAPQSVPGRRYLVMIDPGHGGFDPGTEVGAPFIEKDIALAIALRLRQGLLALGIDAELTRDGDYFLTLPERTSIAERAGADLFVSIHLNSSSNTETTGIETYYLNNTTDRATIRLARIENGAQAPYGAQRNPNLNYILSDLRQNYKANESAFLARMIEAQTTADLDAAFGIEVNALGAKMGPFYVLVGAEMPAVLVECGFLSNPGEARMLASERYQEVLAHGIANGIAQYLSADEAVGNL